MSPAFKGSFVTSRLSDASCNRAVRIPGSSLLVTGFIDKVIRISFLKKVSRCNDNENKCVET